MKQGWIIYGAEEAKKNRWFIKQLISYANEKNVSLELIYAEKLSFGIENESEAVFVSGERRNFPDFVMNRSIFPFLSRFFEKAGVKVFNDAKTAEICNDKRLTHMYLADKGIPMMDTLFFDRRFFDGECDGIEFPCVVKPADGHGGAGVCIANDVCELNEAVKSYKTDCFLVQKIASERGRDLRVYVMGKKILAAMLRSSDADFRSNFSLGGRASVYKMNSEEEALVYKVMSFFNLSYAGIDFIFDKDGMKLNEIEDVVGARMLYEFTDLKPHEMFIDYILSEIEK